MNSKANTLMTVSELLPKTAPPEPVALPSLPAQPLVSIVVPSFKQGRFIRDTIDSILQQSYRPLTIHVIDGNSPDDTVEVLKSYGDIPELQWVSEPDRGVVHAVNKGFAQVTGDIVAIQSSDDVYLPETIAKIVETFRKNPDCGLLYGDSVKVDADGRELLRQDTAPYTLENLLTMRTWIPQPSAFFRREMLDACGGWDESIPYSPDTDLWLRMAFRTHVIKHDDFLSARRMHDEQRDTQKAKIVRDYTQMIRQSPDIAAASTKLQRAAQIGCEVIQVRYANTSWEQMQHKWRLRQLSPEQMPLQSVIKSGLQPIRDVLSKIKRRLVGKST